uniref:Ionotropic receptor n=1 Tax=Glyphodes pyloalis TaxID=1242752 RepID=A0A6M3GVJ6_GLYPY|nr:ionotropic receptor [Glyphodes pyloalis]
MNVLLVLCSLVGICWSLHKDITQLAVDYFTFKDIKYICYFSCENSYNNKLTANNFLNKNLRVSVTNIEGSWDLGTVLKQWNVGVGVVLDASCNDSNVVLEEASKLSMLDATHSWLVIGDVTGAGVDDMYGRLDLSVDADVVVVHKYGGGYQLTDVFNFGRVQGNPLEKHRLADWTRDGGLKVKDNRFKYYRRWDFHNLTLRAVTVVLGNPESFYPEMLLDMGYNPGVAAMTKVAAQLLQILKEKHNFRFNYTVASRWIGEPAKNSTLTVTNSLYWREQDIACTMARIFPKWLDWVDIFFPPGYTLQTKFYYLISDTGVGEYENRFLAPMSVGVWRCACAAGAVCALVLAAAACAERRPAPASFALFSILAAVSQQAYEDGVQLLNERFSSQGRRATLLVIGLTSMLLYNYYTSSVVSWLLNAAAPNIATMDGLIGSDLELLFEDVGYARGWIANPGFFYFSGYKNVKEDELREKKVTHAKRTKDLFQSPTDGIDLVRRGGYAFNTEPYTAGKVISKTFEDSELCKLGSLQMMQPAPVYIMAQKRGPYGQFFTWSLMRLSERGHYKVCRARVGGGMPTCSGRTPRALALGQAAPAFLLFAVLILLSLFVLALEILWHKIAEKRNSCSGKQTFGGDRSGHDRIRQW